jgi:hypothetical protein
MPTGFPPQIAYPLALDSDRTLYLVYNTSEARTTVENSAWEEEIQIVPVGDCQQEIWAENGFANISGEMFYYDAVEKNEPVGSGAVLGNVILDSKGSILSVSVLNGGQGYCVPEIAVKGNGTGAKLKAVVSGGSIVRVEIVRPGTGYEEGSTVLELEGKIFKLKRCLRNMGGKQTKFNPSGTWVRGFVMAEHHNQLVDVAISIERYVLELEDRIAKLEEEPVCSDDAYCVDVTLETNISQDPEGCRETTMQYSVIVNGTFSTFTLDFGDGQSTSSIQSGVHNYASGANIDPVVTVVGGDCTVVQTPISRPKGGVPEVPETPTFVIPIPQVPNFPDILIPDFQQPNPQIELPQIVFPCLNVSPIGTDINIPSIINIVPPVISFVPPNISPVSFTFGPAPTISPATFTFGPAPSISPATFTFGPAPSISPASFTFGPAPKISPASFTFGPAPKISPASFTFGPAPKISPASFTFGPAPKISPASFTFGPAPKISPASFNWGTPPKVTGASFNWGTPPKVTGASFNWGTPPKVTGASFNWGTPPKVTGASFNWGTPPKVTGASFNWGTPPKVTSSFNWGQTPSVTGSFTWGDEVPSVTGSFTWGDYVPSVTGSFTWGDVPSVTASLTWEDPPKVSIEWGNVPTLSCVVTVECGGSGSTGFRRANTLDENFVDDFNTDNFDIEISDIGIPSEIKVVVPKFPDIKITHDIPNFIDIKSDIPNKIVLYQADLIPKEIKIVNESVIPSVIALDSSSVPSSIRIDATSVPGFISLVPVDIPSTIRLDGSEIPESIRVVGIPESIEVKMPSEIVARLEVPENLEIPLVYKGGPVPIQFDTSNLLGGDEQACFALVPCNKK